MTVRRATLLAAVAFALTLAEAPAVSAQDRSADTAGIHMELRAFYYSLAHRDWEAIAAQVLSAKVVAHRPPPDAMVAAEASPGRSTGLACEEVRIRTDGAWAEVTALRCRGAVRGADEFRLIRFEQRWRIVYIDLFDETVTVAAEP